MLLYYSTSTVTLFLKPNPASGVPIYLQLKEQIRHACETGALRPGDSLPGMRALAESMVINPNTVARVYRELEQEGLLELRRRGMEPDEIRRLVEAELASHDGRVPLIG